MKQQFYYLNRDVGQGRVEFLRFNLRHLVDIYEILGLSETDCVCVLR